MKILNFNLSISFVLVLISFTCIAQEPTVSIIQNIRAIDIKTSASSSFSTSQAINHLTDGSGIKNNLHDNNGATNTMWHTTENPFSSIPAIGPCILILQLLVLEPCTQGMQLHRVENVRAQWKYKFLSKL